MYEKFYGLKTSPFRLSPDPAFFFGSKGHNRALAYLRYGINQKEGFIVITGTPGTGKTTLARALLGEMGKSKTVVSEINTTHLQADDVLRMVAASYGLPHENLPKSTLLQRLEEFFLSRFRAGYHVLLIIDESQNLPNDSLEELRMLSNFYSGKDALVQIFLLGQEQFREQLYSPEMEQLRQRVVASCHLDPLEQNETKEYIQHRLAIAGWKGDPQISDRAFARIFSFTKGVPRRINTFCDRLMLYGALEDVHVFRDEDIKSIAKELSIETSPAEKDLAEINPADQGDDKKPSAEELHFAEFSDEVQEIVPVEDKQDPLTMSQLVIETDTELEKNRPSEVISVSNGEDIVVSEQQQEESSEDEQASSPLESKPDWWELVALAVNFSLRPKSHKGITSSKRPLPKGVTEFFEVGLGKKKIPAHMRTGALEDISDEQIQKAIRYFIKKVFLSSTADYYRRLGVERDASQEHIRTHYKYLFRIFQPDKETDSNDWDETFTRRINQAYGALRSEEKRKEYDEFLQTLDAKKKKSSKPSVVLTDEDRPAERAEVRPDLENSKTGTSPLIITVVGIVVIMMLGGGYFFYQKQQAGESMFVESSIDSQLNAPSNEASSNENLSGEKIATLAEELPLLELPAEENAGMESVQEVTIDSEQSLDPEQPQVVKSKKVEIDEPLKKESVIADVSEPAIQSPKEKVKKAEIKEQVKQAVKEKPKKEVKIVKAPKIEKKDEPAAVTKQEKPVKTKAVVKPEIADTSSSEPKVLPKKEPAPKVIVPEQVAKVEKKVEPKPVLPSLDERQLDNFISNFTMMYEEGQIDPFIDLFTENAATNDGAGRDLIEQDYEALFDSTEMRVIDLQGLSWKINGVKATADGAFVVTVLRKGGESMRKFNGKIKLDVVKENKKIKISGMYHTYGDQDN